MTMDEFPSLPSVLIVDDDPVNLQVIHHVLESQYEVRFATSGHQALADVAQACPDLILLDKSMPGMDGLGVLGALRADPGTRDVPVLFVTAMNDAGTEMQALRAGADDFIPKPINPDVLKARVALHVERRRLRVLADRHRDELEQMVRERTLALSIAKEAAETASAFRDTILANINHEFRTPMNGILGMIALASRRVTDDKVINYLEMANISTLRLMDTLTSLIDLACTESSRLTLVNKAFRPAALIDRLVARHREAAAQKGLLLAAQTRLPPDLVLMGDDYRIGQIVDELIGNAIKFSDQGTVSVEVRHAVASGQPALSIEVSDQGVGIPRAFQGRIFKPFVQVDGSASRRHEGNGIGLALCERLALAMQGRLSVASAPGGGSVFTLELPLGQTDEEVVQSEQQARLALRVHQGKKILLAENDAVTRTLIEASLQTVGLDVMAVGSGVEALEAAQATRFDLVLLDLMMPRMLGLDVVRALRRLPAYRFTPVLALTTRAAADDGDDCARAGIDDRLVKPIGEEALLRGVLGWLDAVPMAAQGKAGSSQVG